MRVEITHEGCIYTLREDLADYGAGRVDLGGLTIPIPLDALINLVHVAKLVAEQSEPRKRVDPSGDETGATDSAAVSAALAPSLTIEPSGDGDDPFRLQGVAGEQSSPARELAAKQEQLRMWMKAMLTIGLKLGLEPRGDKLTDSCIEGVDRLIDELAKAKQAIEAGYHSEVRMRKELAKVEQVLRLQEPIVELARVAYNQGVSNLQAPFMALDAHRATTSVATSCIATEAQHLAALPHDTFATAAEVSELATAIRRLETLAVAKARGNLVAAHEIERDLRAEQAKRGTHV